MLHPTIVNNLTVLILTTAYTIAICATWLWCRPWA
jgi:hypothetical protein